MCIRDRRSPFTREPLQVVSENGREALASASGERFPVRNGIPAFLKPKDLTGDNGKYNRLYDIVGGFYNDIQRVYSPLKGFDLKDYFLSYMRLLEVKPGDSVLETSVGTGLNFRYLLSDAKPVSYTHLDVYKRQGILIEFTPSAEVVKLADTPA